MRANSLCLIEVSLLKLLLGSEGVQHCLAAETFVCNSSYLFSHNYFHSLIYENKQATFYFYPASGHSSYTSLNDKYE